MSYKYNERSVSERISNLVFGVQSTIMIVSGRLSETVRADQK